MTSGGASACRPLPRCRLLNAHVLMKLKDYGLQLRKIDGSVGAASALKLTYAGITKRLFAIATTMVLARRTRGLRIGICEKSWPLANRNCWHVLPERCPTCTRKPIAGFKMSATADLSGNNSPIPIFEGAAGLFARMAADIAGENTKRETIDQFFKIHLAASASLASRRGLIPLHTTRSGSVAGASSYHHRRL